MARRPFCFTPAVRQVAPLSIITSVQLGKTLGSGVQGHVQGENLEKAEGRIEASAGKEKTAEGSSQKDPEENHPVTNKAGSLDDGSDTLRGTRSFRSFRGFKERLHDPIRPLFQGNRKVRSMMRWNHFLPAVLLSVLLLNGCAIVTIPLLPTTDEFQERSVDGEGKDKILLLDISGVISEERRHRMGFREDVSMVDELKEALKKAEKDKNVKGLILRINSPGGTVTASDIIHHELLEHKKRSGQRITACLMDVGASGAYYVATAADEIVSHPTTITGSIGVVAMKFNIQGLMSKIGVEQETIKSGEMKDILSPFRPSTPEEQKVLQTIIDTLYKRFVDVIVDGRKPLTRAAVEKLADGRIYTADQALSAQLIDRIGYLDQAIEGTKKALNLAKASVIVYYRPDSYKSTIYSGLNAAPPQVNLISISGQEIFTPPGVRFMYLWLP